MGMFAYLVRKQDDFDSGEAVCRGGGRGAHSAACSQSVETLSGDAKTACSTQLSGSETLASDVCTEDAVSYIRKIVVHSCLFSLELSGQADVRASTVSNARSGPGLWLI